MTDRDELTKKSIDEAAEFLAGFLKETTQPAFISLDQVEWSVDQRMRDISRDSGNLQRLGKKATIRTELREAFAAHNIPFRAVGNLRGFVNPAMAEAFELPGAKKKDLRGLRHDLLADGKVQDIPFVPEPEEPS